MINFEKIGEYLILKYYSDFQSPDWIDEKLKHSDEFLLKGVFLLDENSFYEKVEDTDQVDSPEYLFKIGKLEGEYYQIDKLVLKVKNDFYFHKDIKFEERHFVVKDKISLLKKIDENANQSIYIGGTQEQILPFEEFERLIEAFPSTHEIKLYRNARVTAIINNYFDNIKDGEAQYVSYINKKSISNQSNLRRTFKDSEIEKYETLLGKLKYMLNNEIKYSENQWQEEIIQIMLLIYPKYISIFKEVKFKDIYSNKIRRLDFGLVDYNGNLDIVEIKIPFDKDIVSKSKYRDNHIPNRDLSGTIMQIEKYIFYLNKLGKKGEVDLTLKYKNELPDGLEIRIVNPKGIIIMGRENHLNKDQLNDFEIIKRKYKNVIDIFTYDDLIRRMEVVIKQLKKI